MTDSIAFRGRRHKFATGIRTNFDPAIVTLPIIQSLSQNKDTLIGGTPITITGGNFIPGMIAMFSGIASPSVTVISPTVATVTVAQHYQLGVGTLTLSLPGPGGGSATTPFIYEDPEMLNGFRLTASSSQPVPQGDVPSASTLYLTPTNHGRIALFNGSFWQVVTSATDISLSLSGLIAGRIYDVFAYVSSNTIFLETGPVWTNDTTRATALTRLDGVWVKSGDSTRRYVGSFKSISSNATCDTQAQRFVYSLYNQAERDLLWLETTDSWTYNSTTIRGRGGLATARVEFVVGQPSLFSAEIMVDGQGATAGNAGVVGVGLDTTASFSGNSACVSGFADTGEPGFGASNIYRATYSGVQTVGYHAAYWCERVVTASASITMYGDHGVVASTAMFSHLRGRFFA